MADPLRGAERADLIAAAALFAAACVLIGLGGYESYLVDVPLAVRFAAPALACLGVVIRRSAPSWCLALGSCGVAVELFIGFTLGTVGVFTDNVYSFARYGPRRAHGFTLAGIAAVVVGAAAWVGAVGADAGQVLSSAAIAAIVLASPFGTGIIVRQAHDRARLEAERAEQTARLADVRRREAVLRERTVMARELHDTVANYLSAIALQSTGLQARADPDPATVRSSVGAIRRSSVEGLAELRRIIGLLRAGDAGEDLAAYRLDQVAELVERMREVGLAVAYTVEGSERELPGEVETAAYRVVQEALTNALKHGSDASVAIAYGRERVSVTVDNDLRRAAPAVPGGGAGLVGMTERVRLLGGELQAGPDAGRWRVRAVIPTEGSL